MRLVLLWQYAQREIVFGGFFGSDAFQDGMRGGVHPPIRLGSGDGGVPLPSSGADRIAQSLPSFSNSIRHHVTNWWFRTYHV